MSDDVACRIIKEEYDGETLILHYSDGSKQIVSKAAIEFLKTLSPEKIKELKGKKTNE